MGPPPARSGRGPIVGFAALVAVFAVVAVVNTVRSTSGPNPVPRVSDQERFDSATAGMVWPAGQRRVEALRVCDRLDLGVSFLSEAGRLIDAGLPNGEAGLLLVASVGVYCPDHISRLEEFIEATSS